MFPTRYFADRYFAPRYWPKVGEDPAPPVVGGATTMHHFRGRRFTNVIWWLVMLVGA